jgi:glycosyltransferase involved in cell wall biosynthesis
LAALEAMACEVPVVSSNAGGIPEVNLQGVTGFMSNVGDVQDMARNALYILKDDETLQQFRNNALDQARRFDIENILPLYEKYYQHIMDNYNNNLMYNI